MASEHRARTNGETDWDISAGDEVGSVVRLIEAVRNAAELPDDAEAIRAVRLALVDFDESDLNG